MSIDIAALAGRLAAAGAPVLAQALAVSIPPPFGALVGNLAQAAINALSESFGTPKGDAKALEAAIDADPAAFEKVEAVERRFSEGLQAALKIAEMQIGQNKDLLTYSSNLSLFGKIFFAGWRPAFCWIVNGGTIYILSASVAGWPPIPLERWAPIWGLFAGAMGLRSLDKYLGTSPDSPAYRVAGAIASAIKGKK